MQAAGGGQSLAPEHMGQLVGLLEAGLSPEAHVRQPAEAVLDSWKELPGYFSLLKELVVSPDAPAQARWLGAMCFKNAIKRSWRKSRHNSGGVSEDERQHLRVHVLEFLDVDDERISKQVAEIVSQIARYEFPGNWPELFPGLLGRLEGHMSSGTPHDLTRVRTLLRTLKSVIKVLVSKRLPADKRAFAELAPSVFHALCSIWSAQSDEFLSACSAGSPHAQPRQQQELAEAQHSLGKVTLYCMQTLRSVLLDGMSDFRGSADAPTYLNMLGPRLQAFVECYMHLGDPEEDDLPKCVRKCIMTMAETAVMLQDKQPQAFSEGGFLLPYLELFRELVASPAAVKEPAAPRPRPPATGLLLLWQARGC